MIDLRHLKPSCIISLLCLITSFGFSQHLPGNGVYHTIKTTDGISLYTLELGNSNAENTYIVLHGGFGAEHSYLTPLILPHTDSTHFILFDQRGSLRSPAADSLITFRKFVDDIELLRKEFELEKINILAHSNGSTIALEYLYFYPELVNKVILIGCPLSILDTKFLPKFDSQKIADYQNELGDWQKRVDQNIAAKLNDHQLMNTDSLTGIEKTLKQKITYSANHTYLMNAIERTQNAFFNPDVFKALQKNENAASWSQRNSRMSEALVKNSSKITVINGEYDFVDPLGHVWKEIGRHLEHLEYLLLPDAGHNLWLDKPDEIFKVLEQKLN